jgi:hypothetical protein
LALLFVVFCRWPPFTETVSPRSSTEEQTEEEDRERQEEQEEEEEVHGGAGGGRGTLRTRAGWRFHAERFF